MKIRTNKEKLLAKFHGIKVIVAGENDPLIELKAIKSIANRCNCSFFTLAGGHLSYLESRKNFIKLCISSKK
jgi:uncharacterized protein (UPF0276 family)